MAIVAKLKEKLNTSRSTMDMTKGSPFSLIVRFALPLFLSQTFQQLYNTADSLIVGRSLGTNSLAAVSSSGNLIFLLVSFFYGISMGAGVVISRYFGAGDRDRVSRTIHTDVAFGLVAGGVLTAVGVFLTPQILVWMNTPADVLPEATGYLRTYFSGSLAFVMYNICTGIMNALGDSRRPLVYLIFSSLMNVVLDLLFVAGFGWGAWAAGLATVISQASSVVFCFVHLMKKGEIFTVSVKKVRFHADLLKEIVKYGLPAGIQNSVIGFANVIVVSQINSFGKIATAGFGTHAKIEGFTFIPIVSFNMAITTYISQNLGAKEYDRAKKGAKIGILIPVAIAEAIGVVSYFIAPYMIALFDSSPDVIALGTSQTRIVALFYFLLAFSHSVASICRGAGKAIVPMTVMLSVWCVFRILYIFTVKQLFNDVHLIYWAYPITWAISSVIYLIYYFKSDWVHGFENKREGLFHRAQSPHN